MATRYSQDIKTDINKLTIATVQSLYEWITHCVKEYNADVVPEVEIQYERGEISCTTDNYNEFVRDTYGLSVKINDARICYYDIGLSFYIRNYFEMKSYDEYVKIVVYSNCIDSISTIVPSLKKIISEGKITTSTPIQRLPEITVNVGGDLNMNGSAIGNNNEIENQGSISSIIETKTEVQQGVTSFWEGVGQQIVANWIWWLLGIIGTAIVIYWA